MSVQQPLGVLFIGGMRTHLELFAPTFASDPRVRIVGVTEEADAGEEVRALSRAAAEWLGVPFFDDLSAAVRRDDVHVISVSPAIERRARVMRECAATGKHLYLDKPLAASSDELAELVGAFRVDSTVHRAYSFAETPWMTEAFRAAESGALGTIVAANAEVMFAKGTPDIDGPVTREETGRPTYTFFDAKRDLAEIGFYAMSAIARLAPARIDTVAAVTGNYFFEAHRARDIEDFGAAVLRTENGFIGSITAGRYGTTSHPAAGIQRLRLIGTEGSAVFDAWTPRLSVHSSRPVTAPQPDPIDPLSMWPSTTPPSDAPPAWISPTTVVDWAQADVGRFIESVMSGDDVGLGLPHAIHVNEITLAAYESARTGAPVRVRNLIGTEGER